MSTITCKVQVSSTEKRFSKKLVDATGNFVYNRFNQNYVSIGVGDSPMEHNFTKLCVVTFVLPTVIQLVIGGVTSTITAHGPMTLPFAGKLIVAHPGGGATAPVEYNVFTS